MNWRAIYLLSTFSLYLISNFTNWGFSICYFSPPPSWRGKWPNMANNNGDDGDSRLDGHEEGPVTKKNIGDSWEMQKRIRPIPDLELMTQPQIYWMMSYGLLTLSHRVETCDGAGKVLTRGCEPVLEIVICTVIYDEQNCCRCWQRWHWWWWWMTNGVSTMVGGGS